ncbi:hypothetical protein T439DRAFT_354453 [Meredithblackwellia eburnea MCA 4105]
MSYQEFNEILELLSDERIKSRSDGVSRFRTFLDNHRNFTAISNNPKHSWLKTLQALFHLVITERNHSVSKPSAPVAKRLEEATNLVKWTVERVHLQLGRKVIKATLNHLIQMIGVRGRPETYALTYLRTLRTLLLYPAHREHLDHSQWDGIVAMCFAAVLGDKIKVGQELKDEQAMEMDVDDDPSDIRGALRTTEEEEELGTAGSSFAGRRMATQIDIELLACIETAFRSTTAPFNEGTNAKAILVKFVRFFDLFPTETTAHVHAVTALNHAFAELDLNAHRIMGKVGVRLWPHLLNLWPTKNSATKEQLIIALQRLFPFVTPRRAKPGPAVAAIEQRIGPLFEALQTEPTLRWREGFELDIDNLRLGLSTSSTWKQGRVTCDGSPEPYTCATFRRGYDFSSKHAVAWAVLELGANSLAKLYEASEAAPSAEPPPTPSESSRSKRKKEETEEPVAAFVDSLRGDDSFTVIGFRLQILLFLVERHWMSLHLDIRQRISRTINSLLSHEDLQIQRWSFLVIAAIADLEDSPVTSSSTVQSRSSSTRSRGASEVFQWDHVWSIALRRITNPAVCRTAAHTANVLLARSIVSEETVAASVEVFCRDLDVQAPSFPSDSVCEFLGRCLSIVSSNFRLSHLQLPEKTFSWLSTGWKPLEGVVRAHLIGQSRPRADPFDAMAVATLIGELCGISDPPAPTNIPIVPDGPISSAALDFSESGNIREFIAGKVPDYHSAQHANPASPSTAPVINTASSKVFDRRIAVWLERLLENLRSRQDESTAATAEAYWLSLSLDMIRRHLELATMALVADGLVDSHTAGRSDPRTVKAACDIISSLSPTLTLRKWLPEERSKLLESLSPLFIPISRANTVMYPVLLPPGLASDIPLSTIPHHDLTAGPLPFNFSSPHYSLLQSIWKSDQVSQLLEELFGVCKAVLVGDSDEHQRLPTPTQEQAAPTQHRRDLEDDGFGRVKEGTTTSTVRANQSSSFDRAHSATVSLCIRGMVSYSMASSQARSAVRVQEIVDAVIESEGEQAIVIAEKTFEAVQSGIITFSVAQAESLLEHIGGVLLRSYRFARDTRFALAALQFLECTAPVWISDDVFEDGVADFRSNAWKLVAWYTISLIDNKLYAWRVRFQFTAFLDTFLSLDSSQSSWDPEREGPIRSDGSPILPSSLLPTRLADPDLRVRFFAATATPKLFTALHVHDIDSNALFNDIRTTNEFDLDQIEHMYTQILCNANIIIISGHRRRAPWHHLIQVLRMQPEFHLQIEAALQGVAARLNISPQTLHQVYSRYFVHQSLKELDLYDDANSGGVERLVPPHRGCGYRTLGDMRRAEMRGVGGYLLSWPNEEAFSMLAATLQLSDQACVLACLPQAVADVVLKNILNEDLRLRVLELGRRAGATDIHSSAQLVRSIADEIIAAMLLEAFDPHVRTQELHPALADQAHAAETFQAVFSSHKQDITIYEQPPPRYSFQHVVKAYAWFATQFDGMRSSADVYSVSRTILARVHEAPFNNFSIRLLECLGLALALGGEVARDTTVLDSILRSVTPLLERPEIASVVGSVVKWCITEWLGSTDETSFLALCDNLVSLAYACYKLGQHWSGSEDFPGNLDRFLLQAVNRLREHSVPTVTDAYLLWPQPHLEVASVTLSDIQGVLSSSFNPVSKFRIVELLKQHPHFSTSDSRSEILWHLFQSMDPQGTTDIDKRNCLAVADLLFESNGEVTPPSLEDRSLQASRINGAGDLADEAAIKSDIIHELFSLLVVTKDAKDGQRTYEALQLMLRSSPNPSTLFKSVSLTPRALGVATLMASNSGRRSDGLRTRASRTLAELTSDEWIQRSASHEDWIEDFSSLLADCRAEGDQFYAQLSTIVSCSTKIASLLVRRLVHSILFAEAGHEEDHQEKALSKYFQRVIDSPRACKKVVQEIIDVVLYLRHHPRPGPTSSSVANDLWLSLPWELLAAGAVRCGSQVSAILFLELAHEHQGLFQVDTAGQAVNANLDLQCQDLLYLAYSNIDEPDGFYGHESGDVWLSLSRRYRHEGQWMKSLGHSGAEYESSITRSQRSSVPDFFPSASSSSEAVLGVVESLAYSGFGRLAMTVLESAKISTNGPTNGAGGCGALPYELSWQLGAWDIPVPAGGAIEPSTALYSALRALHSARDRSEVMATLDTLMVLQTSQLSSVSVTHPTPSLETICCLLALREVRKWASLEPSDSLDLDLCSQLQSISADFNFEVSERILSTRISLLRAVKNVEQADQVGDFASELHSQASRVEKACLLQLSKIARQSGKIQHAVNAVVQARRLSDHDESLRDVHEELANVLWAQGEHTSAISLLRDVLAAVSKGEPLLMARLGQWSSESRLVSAREAVDQYFDPAVASFTSSTLAGDRARVHGSFATFADSQYEQYERLLKDEKARFQQYDSARKREAEQLKRLQIVESSQLDQHRRDQQVIIGEDKAKLDQIMETTSLFLSSAIQQYALSLAASDDCDDSIHRFVGLWMGAASSNEVQKLAGTLLPEIPSRKFVTLAYQLSARLSKQSQATPPTSTAGNLSQRFEHNLHKLVLKLAREHPFHTLFPIYALRSTSTVLSSSSSRSRRSSTAASVESSGGSPSSQAVRAQAAEDIFDKIRKIPALKQRVDDIEKLCLVYTQWAMFDAKGKKLQGKHLAIPSDQSIRKLRDLAVPVTTYNLPIDPSCAYPTGSFPSIVSYDKTFSTMGGLRVPKVSWCFGSDGKRYQQLFKGNDDIRQDAVMEQAFTLINQLLARDEGCRRRRLHIRTYKVIPLSSNAGLMEFVTNTVTLGSILDKLYKKFKTKLQPSTVRERLRLKEEEGKKRGYIDPTPKIEEFKRLLKQFPPVFRYFFFETHKIPSLWFDMRLNYSRSVAVSSMIGHIVGLGDRHVSNILVDTSTGEFITIDLGIAFEAGKRLRIPETVPFRLTQNTIDGFGMSGVDGVFRRCAQETLRVLRERSNVVMTVLEVFKHDPLQVWAISMEMAAKVQDSGSLEGVGITGEKEVPGEADRALGIVREKLGKTLSVEYTVNQLIQEATDPGNLGALFYGWSQML